MKMKQENKVDIITGRRKLVQQLINFFPKGFRLRFNPGRYAIEKFIEISTRKIKPGNFVLDAGAGPCSYKKFFSHCKYDATDFKKTCKDITFLSSLDRIPTKNKTYNVVLSTEVLEHVENPEKVLREFYRVLKDKGILLMTAPQGWRIHQEPHNYFYFTKYGLKLLLKNAGFTIISIKPRGGYFWFLADAVRFNGVLEQYKRYWFFYWLLKIIEYPLTNIILPFILFHLDFLDQEKKWTLGYTIEARK